MKKFYYIFGCYFPRAAFVPKFSILRLNQAAEAVLSKWGYLGK